MTDGFITSAHLLHAYIFHQKGCIKMTDQRKDEMPERILLSPEVLTLPITRGPHKYTEYVRADLSTPVPDDVTVSREVLQGVREALNVMIDRYQIMMDKFNHGELYYREDVWRAKKNLASLDAVLEGE